MTSTQQRAAVVTGAGKGMGEAIARRLASDGYAVAVVDIDAENAKRVADEIVAQGLRAIAVGDVDVSDRASVDAAMQRVRDELGPILVLVNNAGISGFKRFMDITDEMWEKIFAVNLTGTFYCTQAVIPDMVDAGWGRILMISSSSAQTGSPYMVHYSASKGGMVAMTKSLAQEFGPSGITVNTIPPGSIVTPMMQESADNGNLGDLDELAARLPVRRLGKVEDIAAAASYLCSDEAGYVTGQIIGVNGGRVI
ncbi:SDR family NAD(P)-dependent oxidoreductase [Mycolicibacterium palauense]|uniref:SDR family NAD(P)-dependent oxidoreductase n=1 Tax=Mycolicibacterium palauense TaxID=2034511 RepID=UPI000BFEEDF8|nr:SDR family NAD(P)-dependent oxidoreductase [Mycolicibacterium palauense]